jgi:OST-HTH/LOTUS domain
VSGRSNPQSGGTQNRYISVTAFSRTHENQQRHHAVVVGATIKKSVFGFILTEPSLPFRSSFRSTIDMSSSSSVIQDVVDQLLLTGTLYDDLLRMLTMKCERRTHAEGWTSSELLIAIPALRLFFQSNRAFPPSYVLASCPSVNCVTRGAVVLYYTTRTAAAAGQQQEDQAPAVDVASYCNTNKNTGRQGKDEHQQLDELPNAISASSTMDSLSTVGSDGDEQEEAPVVSIKAADDHADDAPTTTTTRAAVPHPTLLEVMAKNRLARLAQFEDELVDMIQAAPDQRVMTSRLQEEYKRIRKNEWTQLKFRQFQKLVGTLKKVRIVTINGSRFVVPSSFHPRVDAPPVNQEALKRLEDELVELVRSIDNHRIRISRGCLKEAYQKKYKKPLKLEPTGFFTLKQVLQAMPRLARNKKNRQLLILAPSMPGRYDDAPLPPLRSRAAQQYSGRCSPTGSAALPPTLADPYARSSDLPPPGLPRGLSSTRSEFPPAHAERPAGLPSGLPCGLPLGLPRGPPPSLPTTGCGVPQNDIPRFISQQLALHTTLYEFLCEYIYQFGPVAVDTIVRDVSAFRHFVQAYAKEFDVPSIPFAAVLDSLPQIERVEGRDGMSRFRYVR